MQMSLRRFLVFCLLLIGLLLPRAVSHAADGVIRVDLSQMNDHQTLEKLKYFLQGGVTPTRGTTTETYHQMQAYGMRRMRLPNISFDNDYKEVQGVYRLVPSKRLKHLLADCKRFGFIPHIIIGQQAPISLRLAGPGDRAYGVASWSMYEDYIRSLVRYVVEEQGFPVSYWEVANEWNNPNNNWISRTQLKQRLDDEGYRQYVELYSHISNAFREVKETLADKTILLGGPALSQHPFDFDFHDHRNWNVRFVRDVLDNGYVCDFFSMHFYGTARSAEDLRTKIGWLRSLMGEYSKEMPIWITEWGANAFYKQKDNVNKQSGAGAFTLEFIDFCVRNDIGDVIFLASYEHPKYLGPYLFNLDGSKGHALLAYDYVLDAEGAGAKVESSRSDVKCWVFGRGNHYTCIFWCLDWEKYTLRNEDIERMLEAAPAGVDLVFSSADTISSVTIDSVYLDGAPSPEMAESCRRSAVIEGKGFSIPDFPMRFGRYVRIDFSLGER